MLEEEMPCKVSLNKYMNKQELKNLRNGAISAEILVKRQNFKF